MNEDQFADFLDAMVNGSTPGDTAPPANSAWRIQKSAAERLEAERRSAIWKNLMSGNPRTSSTTDGPGPLTQPALTTPCMRNPWMRRPASRLSARKRLGIVHETMQTGITAMAIVTVVIAAFVAFPIIRGDEATPRVTPTAFAAAPNGGTGAGPGANSPQTSGSTPTQASDSLSPNALYHHPQPDECRIEPMTVDEVMAAVEGKSSGQVSATPGIATRQQITEEEYKRITASHRTWLSCRMFGSYFQPWGMESESLVRADIQRMFFPVYSFSRVRTALEEIETQPVPREVNSTLIWVLPADTYIPMIAEWNADDPPTVSEDGRVTVAIVWMNQDGESITGDSCDAAAPLAADLPIHWTYVWSESSGRWLLDSWDP